ncbi:MAG: glycogen/starch synthase [Muribaculaceae bacterium]|nr:glycogen/starch synthase [Muribaculaceae bacterium]
MPDKAKEYIFEVSWEVCNKVGGIYTVLSTKAKSLHDVYKDHLIFIGPDVWSAEHPAPDFIESSSLLKGWREKALLPEGVEVRVGRWDIPGRPIAILVKFEALYATKDAFYGHMWNRFGVDSLHAYGDYDEACAFSRAAGEVIESLVEYFQEKSKDAEFIAHFDEWTTGMGLLLIKDRLPSVATVFTTHATSIGRSICGNGKPLYDQLKNYNGDQMARELNMESKHSLEKAAAREADCFTTVSDVTARECEQLLERKPDIVTPNGFEPGFVPSRTRFAKARSNARAKLLSVARALTGRNLPENTFLFATSGRCEYRNKGLDAFCDAVARIDDCGTPRPAVAFVMVPAWVAGPRPDLQQAISSGDNTGLADPVITHNLHNYNEDAVNRRIHDLGFASTRRDGSLSLIYVPCYLNGKDGIFNTSYYDLLIGMDATVFPSYYEPWGYTPLESIAFGVPTITTSLSGFGQWIKTTTENSFADCGVCVVDRGDCDYDRVVEDIANNISSLMNSTPENAAAVSKTAAATAKAFDWSRFIDYYHKAYDIALKNNKSKSK